MLFVETYGRSDRGAHRIVARAELLGRNLSIVAFNRPLRVVDLTGAGLAQIGADSRLGAGEYQVAQRWAYALWAHPDHPDGLRYRSRHDPSRACLAIFDRVADTATAVDQGTLLTPSNVTMLAEILDTYDIGYLE